LWYSNGSSLYTRKFWFSWVQYEYEITGAILMRNADASITAKMLAGRMLCAGEDSNLHSLMGATTSR
jgi:hypothetical protein